MIFLFFFVTCLCYSVKAKQKFSPLRIIWKWSKSKEIRAKAHRNLFFFTYKYNLFFTKIFLYWKDMRRDVHICTHVVACRIYIYKYASNDDVVMRPFSILLWCWKRGIWAFRICMSLVFFCRLSAALISFLFQLLFIKYNNKKSLLWNFKEVRKIIKIIVPYTTWNFFKKNYPKIGFICLSWVLNRI